MPGLRTGDAVSERARAEREARVENLRVSRERDRPRVIIPCGPLCKDDVTEDVVSVLDALKGSLDWGSGFLDDTQLNAANRLMTLLKFECGEEYSTGEISGWSRPGPGWDFVPFSQSPENPGGWDPIYAGGNCTKLMGHEGPHGQEEDDATA